MSVLNQAGQGLEAARSPIGKSPQCHNASQIATRAERLSIAPRRPLSLPGIPAGTLIWAVLCRSGHQDVP